MTHPGDTPVSPGAMVIDERLFDVLIIGSGAGGGTMAGALAAAGRKVLLSAASRPLSFTTPMASPWNSPRRSQKNRA